MREDRTMNYLVLLGRVLYVAIFIMAAPGHFAAGTIGYAASKGVPMASIAVPLFGMIALAGGLSILLGYRAKLGAWLIVLFLVPVTLMMHNFWTMTDPNAAQMQQIMFMKNVSMLGAALMIAHFGSGPLSLDGRMK
jgi:putative oxidoreductase